MGKISEISNPQHVTLRYTQSMDMKIEVKRNTDGTETVKGIGFCCNKVTHYVYDKDYIVVGGDSYSMTISTRQSTSSKNPQ